MVICYYASQDQNSVNFLKLLSSYPTIWASISFKDVMKLQRSPVAYVPAIVDERCYVGRQCVEWLKHRVKMPVSRSDPAIHTHAPAMMFSSDDGLISTNEKNFQPILQV